MNNLTELERVLDNLEYLADTFCAIDLANQNALFVLPGYSLTVPTELLKSNAKKARELWSTVAKEISQKKLCCAKDI